MASVVRGQDETGLSAFGRAGRPEDVGWLRTLVFGAEGCVPRRAQGRVIVFFCPI